MRPCSRRWPPAMYCLAGAVLHACRPLTPLPRTPPPAEQTAPASREPAVAGVAFRYTPGTYRYTVHTVGSIELASDTLSRRIPVETTARFTLTLAPAAGRALTLTGSVDSFAVSRGEGIPAPDMATEARATFSAILSPTGNVSAFKPPPEQECGSPLHPLLTTARDLVVAVPQSLAVGSTWQDTATATTCRGEIPVTTHAIREYVVEGPDTLAGVPAIRVRRTSTLTLGGSGTQAGQPVALSGTGRGTATLYLSPAVGALIGAVGASRSTLTVETPRGPVPFRQQVEQRITLER